MTDQNKKGTKGEPWKPKEKYDKKANKEKAKVQQDHPDEPSQEHETQVDHKEHKDLNIIIHNQDTVPKFVNQDFVNHLKVFQKHTTQSILLIQMNPILFHPALLNVCRNYQNGKCIGSTYRCVEFLRALKIFIYEFQTPKGSQGFGKALDDQLEGVLNLVSHFRSFNEGMKTAYKFIRYLMTLLFKSKIDEQDQKDWLCNQIDQFMNQKIVNASNLIIQNGSNLIQQNNHNQILVYARSYLVENLLIQQHRKGIPMTIYVVDNPPLHEGRQLLQSLESQGLKCSYILLSHVSYIIKKVDKIFVGAHSMLNNGSLISRVGTAFLASMASVYRVPFHVFCESYKFSEMCQIDSLSWNELALQKTPNQSQVNFRELGLMYDVTPTSQINMVVTEIGLIPPTSVKALIREFKKYNYVDHVEIPKKQQE